MQTLQTRAGTVAYATTGAGRPLVLLPSGAHDHHDFDPLLPALHDAGHRTIAVDWPGHGASPAPSPGRATAPAFADAVEDLVAALAPEGAALVGTSVGGFAAARLAIRRPELVRGLVLVDTGGFDGRGPLVQVACRALSRPALLRRVYPRFARTYMRPRGDEDRRVLAAAIEGMRDPVTLATYAGLWRSFVSPGHDLRIEAAGIAAPTLVVWGRRDPVISVKRGRLAAATIPGARLVELDAGHVPFATERERFLAEVLPFLDGLARSEPAGEAQRSRRNEGMSMSSSEISNDER